MPINYQLSTTWAVSTNHAMYCLLHLSNHASRKKSVHSLEVLGCKIPYQPREVSASSKSAVNSNILSPVIFGGQRNESQEFVSPGHECIVGIVNKGIDCVVSGTICAIAQLLATADSPGNSSWSPSLYSSPRLSWGGVGTIRWDCLYLVLSSRNSLRCMLCMYSTGSSYR
jgi:hypothetical protein